MHSKIALGTANFTQPYGIFSNGKALDQKIIDAVFKIAAQHAIHTVDTAFAYGDLLDKISDKLILPSLEIITKFSVLDDYATIFKRINSDKNLYLPNGYYGLLIHDPANLKKINKKDLLNLFYKLKEHNLVKKIGVSLYDLTDLDNFKSFTDFDLIQIPLNPLNQTFINDLFIDYVSHNNLEVHARSLFLQGVLLADHLPKGLKDLEPLWNMFIKNLQLPTSRLESLLSWAFSHKWIRKWVFGVSSIEEMNTLLKTVQNLQEFRPSNSFSDLKNMSHPLTDPRNWIFT